MFADFDYYKDTFKGSQIQSENEYTYLGQQASRYIKKYTNEVSVDTKDCECALAEYLQKTNKSRGINSETIPNAYSVNYATNDKATMESEIGAILELYLGDVYSSVGIVKLVG